ncbi:hypothetical protein CTI12_AA060770 [Artemisia annua]|uniref:Uncharacterized protein n=1 Tax=Artemisia annua TaxID=35608 RepID=A0A2U1Q8M5_ARTAN|nr:hypothetical protein CTI12_AA060770 [Artemisia annua]
MSPKTLILIITIITITLTTVKSDDDPGFIKLPGTTTSSVCGDSLNAGSCPVKCFRASPVCGVDNVTYWCGCSEAICAGVDVAKAGFCEFGDGGSGAGSGQALLLVHIVWLVLLGFFVLFGFL